MTKNAAIALGLVLALLVAVQHFGLEEQPETKAEAPMKRVPDLKASEVLPSYIASLFFGAFRAVVVDILWIQLRKVEEEKRWYERREIVQLISYVQPRNPMVWDYLGWHSAYNVANGFTDPEKSWEWVKFGLLWLRKGVSTLPNDPYLKDQLAYTLWHKVSWRDGELDMDLLRRVEQDAELQAALRPEGVKGERPLTSFELAIPWLEMSREELLDRDFVLTPMGLYLYPDSVDGFARQCMVMQGMYDWKRGRPEEAKAWFRKAQQQVETMLARSPQTPPKPGLRKYKNSLSSIFDDWAKLYAKYPDVVDLEVQARRSGKAEDRLALLKLLQGALAEYGPIDETWFWNRSNPRSFLNALKLGLISDKVKGCPDVQESNDSVEMASVLRAGETAIANLAPEGLDVDWYWLAVGPPAGLDPPPPRPLRPATLTVTLTKVGQLNLKVTIQDRLKKSLLELMVTSGGETTIPLTMTEYGSYMLKVEADPAVHPWPADTRYKLQYAVKH